MTHFQLDDLFIAIIIYNLYIDIKIDAKFILVKLYKHIKRQFSNDINQKSANVISTLVGILLESSPVQLIGNLETSFSIEKLLKEKHESSDLLI